MIRGRKRRRKVSKQGKLFMFGAAVLFSFQAKDALMRGVITPMVGTSV